MTIYVTDPGLCGVPDPPIEKNASSSVSDWDQSFRLIVEESSSREWIARPALIARLAGCWSMVSGEASFRLGCGAVVRCSGLRGLPVLDKQMERAQQHLLPKEVV